MNKLRHSPATHLAVVVAMLMSWLAITNHCALAGLHLGLPAADSEMPACCHRQRQAPEDQAPCPQAMQCCKTAKASLSGKLEVEYDSSKFQVQLFALLQTLSSSVTRPSASVLPEHGPPSRSLSFAESVLQHSLLSHAPPLAA